MDIKTAIKTRRSVRVYRDTKIEEEKRAQLNSFIESINAESGQNFQIFYDDPTVFTGVFAYGQLINVKNYIVVVGKKGKGMEEICGYYGEKIVIFAQTLGLNTCWAGISYSKSKVKAHIASDEKIYLLIALGYGKHSGKPRKCKTFEQVTKIEQRSTPIPDWFKNGVEFALLAPTAMNQQKFTIVLKGDDEVEFKKGVGFYTKTDLGIVKYHFEIGRFDS